MPDPFAVLLRRYRLRGHLTQQALSELTGVSVRSIGAIERAAAGRAPRLSTVLRLAEALGLDGQERAEFTAAGQLLFWSSGGGRSGRAKPDTEPAPARYRSLPPATEDFVGREADLQQLTELVCAEEAAKVVAVVGLGGVGKTALAVRWGYAIADHFTDGQLFVDLQGFGPNPPRPPIEVVGQLLRELGLPAQRIPSRLEDAVGLYRSTLADRQLLVVLDNARDEEHVRLLLPTGRRSVAVVTSRHSLAGLVVHNNAHRLRLTPLTESESVHLLRRIAGPDRADADPEATRDIIEACDRLPLVIRIAAVLLLEQPQQSLRHLANELRRGNPLETLTVDGDPHSSVWTVLDHSYHALPAAERRAFDLIGVFPGSDLTAEDLAALSGGELAAAKRSLHRLGAASLAQSHTAGRFRGHDLVRKYAGVSARSRLTAGERAAAFGRLLAHYLDLTAAAASILYPQMLRLPGRAREGGHGFADAAQARARLDAERLNLLVALDQAAGEGRHQAVIRLNDALRGYFWLRHDTADWPRISATALAAARAAGDQPGLVSALISYAQASHCAGAYAEAARGYEEALSLSAALDWPQAQGTALGNLGVVHIDQGRIASAVDLFHRSIQIYRDLGNKGGLAVLHGTLGLAYRMLGNMPEARTQLLTAIELGQGHVAAGPLVMTLAHLGDTCRVLGDTAAAATHLADAMRFAQRLGRPAGEALAGHYLAALRADEGDFATAFRLARRALTVARETNDNATIAYVLLTLGSIHELGGQLEPAEAWYADALTRAHTGGEAHAAVEAIIGLASTAVAAQRCEQAADLIDEALRRARALAFRRCEAKAVALRARLPTTGGRGPRDVGSRADL